MSTIRKYVALVLLFGAAIDLFSAKTIRHKRQTDAPLIRGAGALSGYNPILDDGLVHFNTTGQNQSLIITGVKMSCGERLMAIQIRYNNTLGPRYGKWEQGGDCVYPVTHNLTFEFDETEWFNKVDVSVIDGFPRALTLHTNKRQLPACGVHGTQPISERGERLWGIAGIPAVGWTGFSLSGLSDVITYVWIDVKCRSMYMNSYNLILMILNCYIYLLF